MIFKNDKIYNVFKWIAMVFLPAFTTFYGVIGATCNIPHTQEVLTIMVAFDTFLGALLGIGTSQYLKNKENEDRE